LPVATLIAGAPDRLVYRCRRQKPSSQALTNGRPVGDAGLCVNHRQGQERAHRREEHAAQASHAAVRWEAAVIAYCFDLHPKMHPNVISRKFRLIKIDC
jgi:hypothetical protein